MLSLGVFFRIFLWLEFLYPLVFFFCFFLPRVDSGGVFHAFSEGLGGGFLESVWKQSEGHVERSWLRFEYLILILISFFFFSLYFGLHFLGW